MKQFADENLDVADIILYQCKREKNIMAKRCNAGNHHFLFFSQCFQKIYVTRDFVVKGYDKLKRTKGEMEFYGIL